MILAALEAACTDEFNIHGVLATTMPVGPVIIVNGPIRNAIGMNSGGNVLGQGNRANLAIGRAAAARHPQRRRRPARRRRPSSPRQPGQAVVLLRRRTRRALHGSRSPWSAASRPDASTVTLFPGEGPRCVVDQLVREPEALARTMAVCLRTVHHPKLPLGFDAVLVVGPEHAACSRTRDGRSSGRRTRS